MVYGIGTRSFNRSTEHRQMKKERAAFTAAWTPGADVELAVACTCMYRPYPHLGHEQCSSQRDWKTRKG